MYTSIYSKFKHHKHSKNKLPFTAEYESTDSVIGNVHGIAVIPRGIPVEIHLISRSLFLDLF